MSWLIAAVTLVLLVAVTAAGRALQDPVSGTASWDAARAAGFTGYLLLWASVAGGVCMHMRFRPGWLRATVLLEAHRIVSALALAFVLAHAAALLMDPVVAFTPLDVALGFTSSYRPVAVAAGAAALWLLSAVLATTALAPKISHRAWRRAHYLAFPAWLMALLHGLFAGTDSDAGWATLLYVLTAAVLAFLFALRLFGRGWAGEPEAIGSPVTHPITQRSSDIG
jgi:sulfoxide reductase heme-binding subunit YedZ